MTMPVRQSPQRLRCKARQGKRTRTPTGTWPNAPRSRLAERSGTVRDDGVGRRPAKDITLYYTHVVQTSTKAFMTFQKMFPLFHKMYCVLYSSSLVHLYL